MDDAHALEQLKALKRVPGALKVITNEILPHLRADKHDPRSGPVDKALARDPRLLQNPANVVCHDVVAIEGPDADGRWTARTAEGDWTVGAPADLLRRLTEAGRA